MRARAFLVVLVALVVAAPASASQQHPTLGQLEHEVMCPTCHTLLELSHAPVAQRMRVFIRRRIAAGDTDSQIKARLVAQFGEAVLAAPPTKGFGLLAWLLPFAGLIGIGALLASLVRHWARAGPVEPEATHRARLDPELARRLDQELAHFDG